MNSLLNKKLTNQQSPTFNDFAKSMTPDGAKAQLEYMLKTGQITKEQLENAKIIANQFIK